MQFVIRDGNAEARAEHFQLVFVQLLLLVGDVLAFARFAQTVTLDGLGQNNRRRAGVINRGPESRMDLDGIVSAEPHASQLLVGQMLDHLEQPGIAAKQVLTEVGSALHKILLILSVADLAQPPNQQAIAVVLNERVPVCAPYHLDDVPAGSAENGFQFLNDLAIAAHWAVEPLQVAVDDEDEVVESLARSQGNGAQRLRFIHFAVTEKRPDLAASRLLQSAVLEILDEARMIDRLNRSQSHGDGGELPEIGHEPGMRVRTESSARFQLAAEVLQLLLRDAAFKIGPGVHSGRGVALEINNIAIAIFRLRAEEMVERNLIQRGGGRERGDMAANAFLNLICADYHGQRIPAHQALDPALHLLASGERGLLSGGNGVLVRGGRSKRQIDAGFAAGVQRQLLQQPAGTIRAAMRKNIIQGVDPLPRFQHF